MSTEFATMYVLLSWNGRLITNLLNFLLDCLWSSLLIRMTTLFPRFLTTIFFIWVASRFRSRASAMLCGMIWQFFVFSLVLQHCTFIAFHFLGSVMCSFNQLESESQRFLLATRTCLIMLYQVNVVNVGHNLSSWSIHRNVMVATTRYWCLRAGDAGIKVGTLIMK